MSSNVEKDCEKYELYKGGVLIDWGNFLSFEDAERKKSVPAGTYILKNSVSKEGRLIERYVERLSYHDVGKIVR